MLLVFRDDFDDTDVVNCLAEEKVSNKFWHFLRQGVFKPDSSKGSTESDYFKTNVA